jgi:uncharacterized damage-inducible protein DinB
MATAMVRRERMTLGTSRGARLCREPASGDEHTNSGTTRDRRRRWDATNLRLGVEMTILERLLRHDAWTTRTLLDSSAGLPDAALDREFDIGHRTLRRTFLHIVSNMECWCDLMCGLPQRSMKHDGQGTISGLSTRLDQVSQELLALGTDVAMHSREEELFVDYLAVPRRKKPLGAGLVHIATHGMHHRAQCIYMTRQLGVKNLIEGDALSWERTYRGLETWPAAE